MEVKGKIQDLVARFFSWPKIETFSNTIGVDISSIPRSTKREVTKYIMDHTPNENAEITLKTLLEMSKRGPYDNNVSKEVVQELNPYLKQSMKCKIDENGNIVSIFPLLDEESDIILQKLEQLGLSQGHSNYNSALSTFRTSPKGSLSLLRNAFEGITNEIIVREDGPLPTSFKDKLMRLQILRIIHTISTTDRSRDSELNYAYDLYSLLSHYGSHPEEVDDTSAEHIFTSGSALILLIISRYKSRNT